MIKNILRQHIGDTALFMYSVINMLFILKYGLRFLPLSQCFLLIIFYFVCIVSIKHFVQKFEKGNGVIWSVLSVLFVSLIFIQWYIDPYQIQVDRWSAIHNFIKYLFDGLYPYAAQTHLGGYGSPFPVWQLFHIPFYLLGNVGLSIAFVSVLFTYAVYTAFDIKTACLALLFLLLSPAYVYEVLTRSDMLTNFLLVCAVVILLQKHHILLSEHWLSLAVMCGFIMSTRFSAIIPLIVYFFNDYIRSKWLVRLLFPCIVLTVFALTFLPFLLWNSDMLLFFEYNPFVLQSRQGHLSDFIIFIPLGIYYSLTWKNNMMRYMFNVAIILIVLVIVTFVHNMYLNDNWNELFDSAYDITYLDMSLPFLILLMNDGYLANRSSFTIAGSDSNHINA